MRKWGELTQAEKDTIRAVVESQVRASGHASWLEIARRFNVNRISLRFAICRRVPEQRRSYNRSAARRQVEDDARQAMHLVPEDTRSLTGFLMGDPLPGRSALDMGRGN